MKSSYWTKRVGRRGILRGALLGGAGFAGAALVGCAEGDGDDGAPPATTSTPAGAASLGTSGANPGTSGAKRGGHLNRSIIEDPPGFDMHQSSSYQTNHPAGPAYNNVVKYDALDESDGPESIISDLAESWEVSADGLTYSFNLVSNAKFHNGQKFSSADVKASIERIADPPEGTVSPRKLQFGAVDSIETPDDTTVVFHMSQPFPSFIPILAQGWMKVYSAEDIANDFDFWEDMNGTGPFRLQNHLRGNRVELVRNEDYHVEGRPYLDAVTVHIMANTSTELSSFQAGELDILWSVTRSSAESLKAALGDKFVIDGPTPSFGFGAVDFGPDEMWRDERVRRAVALAIDKEASIELQTQGWGNTPGYHTPGGFWALPREEVQQIPGYGPWAEQSVTEARALLEAAGVQEGHELTLLSRSGSANYDTHVLFIQDQFRRLGLNGTIRQLEAVAVYKDLNAHAFEVAAWLFGFGLDEPDAVFSEFYLEKSPRNYSRISSKAINELFEQQTVETDLDRRRELVNEMERTAMALYGKVITHTSFSASAYWNRVKGYRTHFGTYNNHDHENVWLDV